MRNSDEAIERVLAGLRDVDAPAGMGRRILDGLEERTAQTRVRSRWFGEDLRWGALSYVACGVALAGILVVVLAVPAIRRFGHAPAQTKIDVAPVKAMPAASSVVAAVVPEGAMRGQRVDARGAGMIRVAGGIADSAATDSEDSVAMSEMTAGSFPAPPMPLTEQEKLLLKMVHRTDPVELAILDPRLEALRDAEEKAEFQRFFSKPTVKQSTAEQEQAATGQSAAEQTTRGQSNTERPASEEAVPATEQTAPTQSPTEDPGPERSDQSERSTKPTTPQDGTAESQMTTATTETGPPPSAKDDN